MYKVRFVSKDFKIEHVESCKSYDEAVDRFIYYVRCALELNVNIRCVNIINGKKSIKLFQNH